MADGTRFDEIVENFELFDDWEDRYRYVIDLGKEMPALPEAQRSDTAKVDGCASQVWLVPAIEGEGRAALVHFRGDSDAMIVRGLIAILHALLSGRQASDIVAMDVPGELARLRLADALSAQRSNGLKAMIGRLKAIAERAASA